MALGNFKEALKDLRIVSKRAPGDKDAKAKFDECAKIVRRIEFEKAIEVYIYIYIYTTLDICIRLTMII
jgi:hypothetical protein